MKKTILFPVIFLCVFILMPGDRSYAKIIKNDDPFFTIDIPDNFEPLPAKEIPKDWDAGYRERTGLEDKQPISIGIDIIDEILGQSYRLDTDRLKKDYPNDTNIEKMVFRSLGFDLEGVKVTFNSNPVKSIVYMVQIPVSPKSIGIIVGGTEERKEDILDIVKSVTGSIKANTNWTTSKLKRKSRFSFWWLLLLFIALIPRRLRWLIRDMIWQRRRF
jgi:hypothetical protein